MHLYMAWTAKRCTCHALGMNRHELSIPQHGWL